MEKLKRATDVLGHGLDRRPNRTAVSRCCDDIVIVKGLGDLSRVHVAEARQGPQGKTIAVHCSLRRIRRVHGHVHERIPYGPVDHVTANTSVGQGYS